LRSAPPPASAIASAERPPENPLRYSFLFLRGGDFFEYGKGVFWRRFYHPILGLYHNRMYNKNNMSKSAYSKEYKEIIECLKKARLESGLSQQEVADKLNKPQSYISKIESGERRLDVAEIKSFASIYKKSISYFIQDTL